MARPWLAGPMVFLAVGVWEGFMPVNPSDKPSRLIGVPGVWWALTTGGEALALA